MRLAPRGSTTSSSTPAATKWCSRLRCAVGWAWTASCGSWGPSGWSKIAILATTSAVMDRLPAQRFQTAKVASTLTCGWRTPVARPREARPRSRYRASLESLIILVVSRGLTTRVGARLEPLIARRRRHEMAAGERPGTVYWIDHYVVGTDDLERWFDFETKVI